MFNLPKVYIDNACYISVSSVGVFFSNLVRFNEMGCYFDSIVFAFLLLYLTLCTMSRLYFTSVKHTINNAKTMSKYKFMFVLFILISKETCVMIMYNSTLTNGENMKIGCCFFYIVLTTNMRLIWGVNLII